jgi:hypothetical protein
VIVASVDVRLLGADVAGDVQGAGLGDRAGALLDVADDRDADGGADEVLAVGVALELGESTRVLRVVLDERTLHLERRSVS